MSTTLACMVRSEHEERAARIREEIVPLVDEFRLRQTATGSIVEPADHDVALLTAIRDAVAETYRDMGREDKADAFSADVDDWLAHSLDAKPHFDRVRDAFRRVGNGESALFVGVTRATNSTTPSGVRLELFFVQHHQSQLLVAVEEKYPHQNDVHMDVILLAGPEGFALGNCLVFFPESVAALNKIERQHYAVFFFSKFYDIHGTITAENANSLLAPGQGLDSSARLDPYLSYQVRSLWGYLHDRVHAHFTGPWSMADNAVLKMHWYIGVLEEIKVDVKLILMARNGDVPFIDELFTMIVLERIFRYPLEPRPERNFDAGTGFFLFSYLLEKEALRLEDGLVAIDQGCAIDALETLVAEIEALEHRSTTPDEYRANATQMVRRHLAEGEDPKDKFALNQEQRLLRTHVELFEERPPLAFSELAAA
ncbi:conserved hypothetical protein [Leifsonia xyli subsp. xyli str. CTCB07]|uniref:Uncharacterized protein n=2 Tax=Leifsonia xyli subsp. xyli TaxID=59736 RepID=Q6AEW0_LEIXX|nr:DUF6421 family protein [Leifsonia xyli]AAT89085.1 conserved hypothetical protein [Leifsonia xyli subsp. xyli str. CTCB07]